MRASSVVALALASMVTRLSYAGQHTETDEEKQQDAQILAADLAPHVQYGLGLRGGTYHVGPIYDLAFGFGVEAGVRLDRLALLGDYMLAGMSAAPVTGQSSSTTAANSTSPTTSPSTPQVGGLVQRVGATARYSVAKFAEASGGVGARGDLFVEGGFGEQLVRWSGGGYLHRADISLGAGAGIQFRGTHHHGGYFLAARVTLAAPPNGVETASTPTCAGPCDGATGPLSIDRSVMVMFTAQFGD
jgi:hypothetical protein